jgi:hypothetical protein
MRRCTRSYSANLCCSELSQPDSGISYLDKFKWGCRTSNRVGDLLEERMPERYVDIDRRTPMLLPVDLREWVAKGRLGATDH